MAESRLGRVRVVNRENPEEALSNRYRRRKLEAVFEKVLSRAKLSLGDGLYDPELQSVCRRCESVKFSFSYIRSLTSPKKRELSYEEFERELREQGIPIERFYILSKTQERGDPLFGCKFTLLYENGRIEDIDEAGQLSTEHFIKSLEKRYGIKVNPLEDLPVFLYLEGKTPYAFFEMRGLRQRGRHSPRRVIGGVLEYTLSLEEPKT